MSMSKNYLITPKAMKIKKLKVFRIQWNLKSAKEMAVKWTKIHKLKWQNIKQQEGKWKHHYHQNKVNMEKSRRNIYKLNCHHWWWENPIKKNPKKVVSFIQQKTLLTNP